MPYEVKIKDVDTSETCEIMAILVLFIYYCLVISKDD